jgi:hypothetical protein
MSVNPDQDQHRRNRLLAALRPRDYALLEPHLQIVASSCLPRSLPVALVKKPGLAVSGLLARGIVPRAGSVSRAAAKWKRASRARCSERRTRPTGGQIVRWLTKRITASDKPHATKTLLGQPGFC